MLASPSASPFRDDRPFVCADLSVISFAKLVSRDAAELKKLLSAGEKEGFFYLDLTSAESRGLFDDYKGVLSVMAAWFEQPLEVKKAFAYGSDTQGYKPIGTQTGATENSRDGFETLRVAQHGLDWKEKPLPGMVLEKYELFNNFISKSRNHVLELLTCFSDALGLEGENRYESKHSDDKPSNSSMTFHRYPKQGTRNETNVGHNQHTDISSLAFLFAQQWGLQVPSPDGEGWNFVRPMPGHAIVNVGDSLRFLSGFRLRSVLHRVIPVAEMEDAHRYSIAYFMRPVDGTVFKDSEGRVIKADDWFHHKFDVYRATHEEQRKSTILTGGIADEKARVKIHAF